MAEVSVIRESEEAEAKTLSLSKKHKLQKASDAAFDRVDALRAAAACIPARTLEDCIIQLCAASDILEDVHYDEHRDVAYARIDYIIYSMLDALEALTGKRREVLCGDLLASRYMDPIRKIA